MNMPIDIIIALNHLQRMNDLKDDDKIKQATPSEEYFWNIFYLI